MTLPITTQFKSVATPSGKKAFEAWCATFESFGREIALLTPSLKMLEEVYKQIAGEDLITAEAQHVWLVAFDSAAPKDAPTSPDPRGASIRCEAAGCKRDAAFITNGRARCYEHR